MKTCLLPLALCSLPGATLAQSVCIDFDTLACPEAVTNQFAEATFSSVAGRQVQTACNFDLGTSLPNYVCTADTGGNLTCTDPIFVDFTSPVSGLTFLAGGDDTVGVTGLVDVYENNAFSGTVQIVTDAVFNVPHLIDITGFSGVTRIEIYNITNAGGLAFDDFCFDSGPGCSITPYCEPPTSPNNVGINIVSGCDCSAGSILFGATNLPSPDGNFGYLLIGEAGNVSTDPPGALGDLCVVGGAIGRYNKGSDLQAIAGGATGTVDILNAFTGGGGGNIPTIGGNVCSPTGQTFYFQWWARNGMNPATFTNALEITFL